MGYRREIREATLATIRNRIIGEEVEHTDKDTKVSETLLICDVRLDKYYGETCLIAVLQGKKGDEEGDIGQTEVLIQAGVLEV
jgi:hypothetical protein